MSRALMDDKAAFPRVIAELARRDGMADHMRLAEVLSFAAIDGTHDGDIYHSDPDAGKRYMDLFLSCCKMCAVPESEYVAVIIDAINAPKGCALYEWRTTAIKYLTKRAEENFDLVSEYIDRFDKKYVCYSILLKVDRGKALGILIGKVLYEKFIDKSAIRSILMNCPDLSETLITVYDGMNAVERAAVVKLLLSQRDDPNVEEFLNTKAADDRSKTVQKVLSRPTDRKASRSGGAVKYFESLMATGERIKFGALCELIGSGGDDKIKKSKYASVAENIFFCTDDRKNSGAVRVICFDGKKFFDLSGKKVNLSPDDEVGVLHPFDLADGDPLVNLDMNQPFPQLRRVLYERISGETTFSKRFSGTFLSEGEFAERVGKFGFELCGGSDGKPMAIHIAGGYAVGFEYDERTFACDKVYYYRASDVVRQGRRLFLPKIPLDISELDKRTYSELTYAVAKLFGAV